MINVFSNFEAATKESASKLIENEKSLQKELNSAVKMSENLEIVDLNGGLKVTRSFMGKPVIEYQQETSNNRSVEYRGSIFFQSDIGIGSINTDNTQYIGLLNPTTLEPAIAGFYTIDGEEILHLSTGIDYGILSLKPVKKNQDEVFGFLKSAVEKGYLNEAVLHFLKNPTSLLEATAQYVKENVLNFKDVALFNNNEHIVMFEREEYNYDTEKSEPEKRFNIIQENGTETIFKNLKVTELNALVTIVNRHYLQSGEILYPLSMIIRNSKTLKIEPKLEEIYYVSVPALEDLRNAEYYQCTVDSELEKVVMEISGYVSGQKYDEPFETIEELLNAAEKVNKWIYPSMYICFNQKKVGYKLLGRQNGVSIKTEVKEMKYFFE